MTFCLAQRARLVQQGFHTRLGKLRRAPDTGHRTGRTRGRPLPHRYQSNRRNAIVASPATAGFRGAAREVWEFRIGGYQVCHKWLKDRKGKQAIRRRGVHYASVVDAIAKATGEMSTIDENIEAHGGWPARSCHSRRLLLADAREAARCTPAPVDQQVAAVRGVRRLTPRR
jgi:hypothetical protein